MAAALCCVVARAEPEQPESEEASYQRCWKSFRAAKPEPDPLPGLRAPPDSDRHRRAAQRYRALLATWEKSEAERRAALEQSLTEHLAQYPRGPRASHVRYLRGATRFQSQDFAGARQDLEVFLKDAPPGPARRAAQDALIQSLRGLGDFAAALTWRGPTPEALEEAGRVKEAIAKARAAGQSARANEWSQIGKPYQRAIAKWPVGKAVVLIKSGQNLPQAVEAALISEFSKEKIGIAVAEVREAGIYLLDGNRLIQAVNPRLDTLVHRIRALLKARRGQD